MVERFTTFGADRILCVDNAGNSRVFLTSWTDYPSDEPANQFWGSVDFWYDDLQMLAKLLADIEKV